MICRRPLRIALSLFAVQMLLLAGCNAPKSQLETFNTYFESLDLANSASFAYARIGQSPQPSGEDLLWMLQSALVERMSRNYAKSTEYFDRAEEMLKYYDQQFDAADILLSTAVNDNALPYRGQEYDGIMVNTYKALNFMAQGNMDLARVEFNRATDRQRRAKETFNEQIKKLQAELDKKQQDDETLSSSMNNPDISKILNEQYPGLYQFEAYPDFVNPFSTYMAGLFFNLIGDHAKAVDLLKESCGMVPNNQYIAQDLHLTEQILNGQQPLKDTVWLLFENGLGPVKEEFRIDIPLFLATDKVKYVGIALPRLTFRRPAYPYLVAEVNGQSFQTAVVSDMDRVIQTEFSRDFQTILQRAIISTAAKAAAQYALGEQSDSSGAALASTIMAIYSAATTTADVRMWTSLPQNFQVARFPKPADGTILVTPPGGIPFTVNIPPCNNAVVYVKIVKAQTEPVTEVFAF